MKASLIFALILFSQLTFALNDTLEQNNCKIRRGSVINVFTNDPSPRKYEMCFFSSDSGMDTLTLERGRFNSFGGPSANRFYREIKYYTFDACHIKGGRSIYAKDETDKRYYLCTFFDGSAIESSTLDEGVTSPWNQELNRALGIF